MSNIKTVQPRFMVIDEDIFESLDNHTYSLYTAIRYESDYSSESSKVIKKVSYLAQRAKISRSQAYVSLNILESLGLIKRENGELIVLKP